MSAPLNRPSQRIYRPPVARSRRADEDSSSASSDLRFEGQGQNRSVSFGSKLTGSKSFCIKSTGVKPEAPKKVSVKRSKSFTTHPGDQLGKMVSELEGHDYDMTAEQLVLLRRSLENPKSLQMTQLMQVVSVIVNKAIEKSSHVHGMSELSLVIIDREKGRSHFLSSLLACLREWYNERDKLLTPSVGGSKRRWSAYIAFVTEVYCSLKSKYRAVKLKDGATDTDQQSLVDKHCRCLAAILYDCCTCLVTSISNSPSCVSNIESLQATLRTAGRHLEEDSGPQMVQLTSAIRQLFMGSVSLPSMTQKGLMEIIEFRASRWTFTMSQQLYYFPYTKLDD
ncbi:MIF4G domain-containing protein [Halotydeus destructor]|nr:MIF4G domain-containing protein [Halotydeus destructor]